MLPYSDLKQASLSTEVVSTHEAEIQSLVTLVSQEKAERRLLGLETNSARLLLVNWPIAYISVLPVIHFHHRVVDYKLNHEPKF